LIQHLSPDEEKFCAEGQENVEGIMEKLKVRYRSF
jgi:hypothetical protein